MSTFFLSEGLMFAFGIVVTNRVHKKTIRKNKAIVSSTKNVDCG